MSNNGDAMTPLSERDILVQLANEIDGVSDLGLTTCWIDPDKWAGRMGFVVQHSERIRKFADDLVLRINQRTGPSADPTVATELVRHSAAFVDAFETLGRFRELAPSSLVTATQSIVAEWEATHQAIGRAALFLGLQDDAEYKAIVARRPLYRDGLERCVAVFRQRPVTT
jgi:hypothetical protein